MNNRKALVEDIKKEIKPIVDYLQIITVEGKIAYGGIGLKSNIKFEELKRYGYINEDTTKKAFGSLLDWFTDNLKETQQALEEIEVL